MADKRYYWLRLRDNFFKQKEMKKLRKVAGGDTFTIIYLKLLLLSLQFDGKVVFEGVEETFADEMALELDEDVDNVKFTLLYLERQGLMVEVNPDEFEFPEAIINIGSESSSAERVRRFRKNKKALQCNNLVTSGNADVIECNTEKEIEIEKEIDLNNTKVLLSNKWDEVIKTWNSLGLQKLVSINSGSKREKMLNVRVRDYGLDKVLEAIKSIKKSDFLMGRVNDFVITFDWFIRPNNFPKVLEGNYINKKNTARNNNENGFVNFEPRKQSDRYKYLQEQCLLGQATPEEREEFKKMRGMNE